MEVIFNSDLLVMKIKITYLILSPLVICYFRLILIFDLDHFLGDLPYLWVPGGTDKSEGGDYTVILKDSYTLTPNLNMKKWF